MATAKQAPPGDEYGSLMHTALRKCCDSTPTSIAWNAIQLLGPTWSNFADACAKAEATTGEALSTVWHDHGLDSGSEKGEKGEWYARQILDMAFDQFDEHDWNGMAAYLEVE